MHNTNEYVTVSKYRINFTGKTLNLITKPTEQLGIPIHSTIAFISASRASA